MQALLLQQLGADPAGGALLSFTRWPPAEGIWRRFQTLTGSVPPETPGRAE